MSKPDRLPINCETCGTQAGRLFQSYVDGSFQCPTDALEDPFMTGEQAASIRHYIAKEKQARANFKHGTIGATQADAITPA